MCRQIILKKHDVAGETNDKNSFVFHTVNTFFSTLGPLIAVFTILRIETIGAWGALALGQAIGLFSSIFVSLGTNVNGSNEIANSEESKQAQVFLKISFIQICTLMPASVFSFLVAFLFSSSNNLLAGLGSISINASALTVAWLFYGRGEPKKLLLLETLPRFLITLLSLLVFINTKNVYQQIFIQVILNLLLYVITVTAIFKQSSISWRSFYGGDVLSSQYRFRLRSSAIALVSCLSSISPILILSVAANAIVPIWAVADKVTRYFSIVNEPLTNRYRNLSNTGEIRNIKSFFLSRMFALHIISGAIISLSLFLSGPALVSALSSNKILLNHQSFLIISLSLFINLSIRSPAFLFLASRNNLSGILQSLGMTLLFSFPILYFLTKMYAFSGACLGVLILNFFNAVFFLYQIKSSVILKYK